MKKIKYIVFILLAFILGIANVKAENKIDDITIDIILREDGSAHIIEKWVANYDNGTEGYKSINDIGNMKFSNFAVTDNTGATYTFIDEWDLKASFSEKAHKNGFNYTEKGIELCWGMSYYGKHTYTLSYDVSNVIFDVSDAQVLKYGLIDMDGEVDNFWITISGPKEYADSLDVWGFGYKGYAYVKDGKINIGNQENRALYAQEYVVSLVKFPLGTFKTTNISNNYKDFEDVLHDAQIDTFKYGSKYFFDRILRYLARILGILSMLMLPALSVLIEIKRKQKYIFETKGNGKIKINKINNYRDIPCGKNIFNAYLIADIYKLYNRDTDFIGAFFLKWIFEDKMVIKKELEKQHIGAKEEVSFILKKNLNFDNSTEGELYRLLKLASKDLVLESKELEKWSKNHSNQLFDWVNRAKREALSYYMDKNMIEKRGSSKYLVKDTLRQIGVEVAGLKKFLKEFSRINEKEAIEVKLWKEYLMFAQIFGMANKVSEQFKKLYPDVITEMTNVNIDMMDIVLINNLSARVTTYASSARSAAISAASDYSGGGGGFSSGGGGGGSFGGGGGR